MGSVVDQRTAIVTALKAQLPDAVLVEGYEGSLTPDELRRVFVKTPAVLIVALGFPEGEDQGAATTVTVRWGAFVLTADANARQRGNHALELAEAVYVLALQLGGAGVTAENLYNSEGDGRGVALWSVSWRQRVDITRDEVATAFESLRVQWSLEPHAGAVVDAVDEVALEQPPTPTPPPEEEEEEEP